MLFGGMPGLGGYFGIQLTGMLQMPQFGVTSPTTKVFRWAWPQPCDK
jgi:hypothetical protein